MQFELTTEDLYRICNALNSHAGDLEKNAKKSRAQGHTWQQIEVVEEEVRALRALSKRLIEEKQAAA